MKYDSPKNHCVGCYMDQGTFLSLRTYSVCMGSGKSGKSWDFVMAFPRTGISPGKKDCRPWKVLEIC